MEYKAKVGKIQGNAILSSAPISDDRLKRNNIELFDFLSGLCAYNTVKKENRRAHGGNTEDKEDFQKKTLCALCLLGVLRGHFFTT